MANVIPFIVFVFFVLLLLLWVRFSPRASEMLRESLFRNTGMPYRNLLGLALGVTASILPLASGAISISSAAWVFVALLACTMLLLIVVRPYAEKELDRFAWGLLVVIVTGFGLGGLIYQTRPWSLWIWQQYIKINNAPAVLLEALFLLGVILGFFVVRNWAKEQKDFVSSLSAVLGGAFVATILGKIQGEGVDQIGSLRAFAFYALGFTLSGTLNLLVAARLTANYVNKRSVSSRAVLDFLYGEERTKLIDSYFLKNFHSDPDYAKEWLTETINQLLSLVRREFAARMELRRIEREKARSHLVRKFRDDESLAAFIAEEREALGDEEFFQSLCKVHDVHTVVKRLIERRDDLARICSERDVAEAKLKTLEDERTSIESQLDSDLKQPDARMKAIEKDIQALKIEQLREKCNNGSLSKWKFLVYLLSEIKPSYFYQLVAIEDDGDGRERKSLTNEETQERKYSVICKYLGSEAQTKARSLHQAVITEEMFRVGIAAKWQDVLEYISAPGQYHGSFPYFSSVSGLALMVRKTIIMNRDQYKKFRDKDHKGGVRPADIEQDRGLDEIDYLSYITLPIVNRLGSPTENGLGVVTVDTKLFVVPFKLVGEPVSANGEMIRLRISTKQLTDYAGDAYERNDPEVIRLEGLMKIIVPILELYNKCRVGAT